MSPNSGGTPYNDGTPPYDKEVGAQSDHGLTHENDQDNAGGTPEDTSSPSEDTKEELEPQAPAPIDVSRQPTTLLNRTLRSKGPAHSTPNIDQVDTAGLDGKTTRLLKRQQITMKGYETEQKDHTHTVVSPSLIEYAYITETSA